MVRLDSTPDLLVGDNSIVPRSSSISNTKAYISVPDTVASTIKSAPAYGLDVVSFPAITNDDTLCKNG